MPNRLSRMKYDEVSFVPSGANQDEDGDGAHIMLAKANAAGEVKTCASCPSYAKCVKKMECAATGKPLEMKSKKSQAVAEYAKADDDFEANEGDPSIGSRLVKALSGFFGEVAEIEKDTATVEDTIEELDANELIALINELDDDDTYSDDLEIVGEDDDEDTLFVVTDTPDATAEGYATSQEANMPNIGKIEKSALPADVQQYIADLEKQAGVVDDSDIYKGMTPEAAEMFREQSATIAKMLDDQEMGEAREIAKSFTHLPVNHDDDVTAKALRSLSKADPEAFAEVNRVLTAANAAMASSNVFKEFGSSLKDDSNADPATKVAKRAAEIAKDGGMSIEQARVEAWREQAAHDAKVGA